MREPIRVFHLVNQLTVGGSERQMHVLIRALQTTRIHSSVGFMRLGSGELLEPLRALATHPEEYSLRGSIAQWNTVTQVRRIAERCRREQIDVIHAHDLWANVIAVAAARLARVPVIVSRRDMADFRSATERCLLKVTTRIADAVVANASPIGELAIRDGARAAAVAIIPNGIDLVEFDRAFSRPVSAPLPPRLASVRRIAVIGNMDRPHKGHADVLRAAQLLGDESVDWLFVSDGPLRPQFEAQAASLGLADRVHFVGRRRDIPSVLANVDMLVHASHSEGLPNVVLEALAARLPVIATNVGGTRDLIRSSETGVLVQPHDPRELADAIVALIRDWNLAREYGRAGRALVEQQFAQRRTADLVAQMYEVVTS